MFPLIMDTMNTEANTVETTASAQKRLYLRFLVFDQVDPGADGKDRENKKNPIR